jgi:hypothetical protein
VKSAPPHAEEWRYGALPTSLARAPPGSTRSRVPAGKGNMIGLPQLKARIERLRELSAGLSAEMAAWEGKAELWRCSRRAVAVV